MSMQTSCQGSWEYNVGTLQLIAGHRCAGLPDDDVQLEVGSICLLWPVADCGAHLHNPAGA